MSSKSISVCQLFGSRLSKRSHSYWQAHHLALADNLDLETWQTEADLEACFAQAFVDEELLLDAQNNGQQQDKEDHSKRRKCK